MFAIKHVLAPADLGDSGVAALKYARLIADRTKAKLTALYCDPVIYPVDAIGPSAAMFFTPTPEQEKQMEQDLRKYVDPWMDGRPYAAVVRIGAPVPVILQTCKEQAADFIVMGTHARHGWRRAILGSVSEGVLHGASCPVLIVGAHKVPGTDPRVAITRVVCPVNFTEVSRGALRYAAQIADTFNAELTVIHVIEETSRPDVAVNAERLRDWAGADVSGTYAYREVVLRGGAAERVLDCVEDIGADLLVVGAQHKLFRDATVVGTTTERLVRFASCPVLVISREPVKAREAVREKLGAAVPA